jgi:hypothetical protein
VTAPVTVLAPPIAYNVRMSRTTSAFLGIALLLAGCGGGSGSPTTTSSAEPGPTAAFKYSACMRQHGVPNFPDPVVRSTPGHTSIGVHVTPSVTSSPSFGAAQKACNGVMPAPNPAELAQRQRQELHGKLSFARCMRGHGINGFPDPNRQGEFTPAMVSAAGIDIRSPAVLAAAKACVSSSEGTVSAADIARATSAGR